MCVHLKRQEDLPTGLESRVKAEKRKAEGRGRSDIDGDEVEEGPRRGIKADDRRGSVRFMKEDRERGQEILSCG